MRLSTRFFLTFLASSLLLVVSMLLVMQWSFDRGFLRYVNTLEQNRLISLRTVLEEDYTLRGNWRTLNQRPQLWRQLLHRAADGESETPPPPSPRKKEQKERHFERRLTLYDAEQRPLIGRGEGKEELLPLNHNGRTVGYLGLAPLRALANDRHLRFVERQKHSFLLIALAMAALSALAAIPLARPLVKRIASLAQATHRLAGGAYDTRVPLSGGDELGDLARDFNHLAATLGENETSRRQWVADISHELRTPVAVLRGEIEALQDGIRPLDVAALNSLHGETDRLTRLVEDLYQLALSDLGALTYRKENVDLGELLQKQCESQQELFSRKGLTLSLDVKGDSFPLFGDPQRLQQLLGNLFENSLRYTDAPGALRITLKRQKKSLELQFADSAPAVPAEALPRLVERLYRVDASRNRSSGGAGLGLAICQNIVSAHGGALSLAPSPLGGLSLTLTFPCDGARG